MKKFKIGDTVKVILGKNKGQIGQIKNIFRKKNQIIVDGINTKFKHIKPTKTGEIGKIIQFDAPIHISNVMLCNENGISSRIGFKMENGIKMRIFKKTQNLVK